MSHILESYLDEDHRTTCTHNDAHLAKGEPLEPLPEHEPTIPHTMRYAARGSASARQSNMFIKLCVASWVAGFMAGLPTTGHEVHHTRRPKLQMDRCDVMRTPAEPQPKQQLRRTT